MKRFFGRILSTIIGNIFTLILFVVIILFIGIFSFIGSSSKSVNIKEKSVLEISLEMPIMESEMDEEISLFSFGDDESIFLSNILEAINKATNDDKIEGISLKLEDFRGGATQANDIRKALTKFKESGKFIYAYTNNSSQIAYYISSIADSIFQNPLGFPILQGLSSEVVFYKNAGEKYGIDFQVIRHGAYKSAVEPYMRDNLSTENRNQLSALLTDIWTELEKDISIGRKTSIKELNIAVDSLYSINPEDGLKYKLFDKLRQQDDFELALMSRLDINDYEDLEKQTITLEDYISTINQTNDKNKIAILNASGIITEGNGFTGIQSNTYIKAIRSIKKDKNIKAVVLRINSPGGSANASEAILHELQQLRKTKPIIVSFGDVAASGGYYIAQASDEIFAQPNTITGSIGVLGMVPSFQKLANNLGMTTDYVNTHSNSDAFKTLLKPLSDDAKKQLTKSTVAVYNRFVNRVMEGRKMTFEQVDSIGGGRVWSGTKAKQLGLIDSFGNLEDAIKAAAKKANLENYATKKFPVREDRLSEVLKNLKKYNLKSTLREELGEDGYKTYQSIKELNENKGIQIRMPFEINIK